MVRQYAIDIPFLCLDPSIGFSETVGQLLVSTLDALDADPHSQIFFRDSLWEYLNYDYDAMRLIASQLSLKETIQYADDRNVSHIVSIPVLLTSNMTDEIQKELLTLLCAVHNYATKNIETTYLIPKERNASCITLSTTLNHKTKENPMLAYSNESEIQEFIERRMPELVQLKHKQYQQRFGEKLVSPFTAYKDKAKAKDLLIQAYNDSRETQGYPHYLFTFDKENDTYVEFRHSGQGQYHGLDIANDSSDKEYKRMKALEPYIIEQYRK